MPTNPTAEAFLRDLSKHFGTILIDPPWRFANRTGKMTLEHKRRRHYPTTYFEEIAELPVGRPGHTAIFASGV